MLCSFKRVTDFHLVWSCTPHSDRKGRTLRPIRPQGMSNMESFKEPTKYYWIKYCLFSLCCIILLENVFNFSHCTVYLTFAQMPPTWHTQAHSRMRTHTHTHAHTHTHTHQPCLHFWHVCTCWLGISNLSRVEGQYAFNAFPVWCQSVWHWYVIGRLVY